MRGKLELRYLRRIILFNCLYHSNLGKQIENLNSHDRWLKAGFELRALSGEAVGLAGSPRGAEDKG